MKKLRNLSGRKYMHALSADKIVTLNAGETKDIEDEVADIWLKSKEIEFISDDSKDKEIEALKKQLAEKDVDDELEALKAEAKELKIKGAHLIKSKETLKEKIAEAKGGDQSEKDIPSEEVA